jgi:hypothetical protein
VVKINEFISGMICIVAGVPVLSLFSIFINNMPINFKKKTRNIRFIKQKLVYFIKNSYPSLQFVNKIVTRDVNGSELRDSERVVV